MEPGGAGWGSGKGINKNTVYLHAWIACGFGGGDWFYMAPRKLANVLARFPDEMTCEKMKQPGVLPGKPCADCMGCECMLVAWLYSNGAKVDRMPWNDYSPAKFCGGDACPMDWKVTPFNINKR